MDRDGDGEISEKELRQFVKDNGLELELFQDVFDKVSFSTLFLLSLSLLPLPLPHTPYHLYLLL